MHYRISKTLLLLLLMVLTYKYVEVMSFALSPVNVRRRRSLARHSVVLAKLMTPKLTVLSPNYLRLRPLGRTAVMDRC